MIFFRHRNNLFLYSYRLGTFFFFLLFFAYIAEFYARPIPWLRSDKKEILQVHDTDFLDNFTISTWVKAPIAGNKEEELEIFRMSGSLDGYRLIYLSTFSPKYQHRGIHFGISTSDGKWGRALLLDEPLLADGKWHHIGAIGGKIQTYKEEYLSLFLDGKQIGEWKIDKGGLLSRPQTIYIGQSEKIEIKNTEFYLQALSPRQIKEIYLAELAPLWTKDHLKMLLSLLFLFLLTLFLIQKKTQLTFNLTDQKKIKKATSLLIFFMLSTGLYLSAKQDFFGAAGQDFFTPFQRDSEALVLAGILEKLQGNQTDLNLFSSYGSGWLNYDFNYYGSALNASPYSFDKKLQIEKPYTSSLGLQSTLFVNSITRFVLAYYNNYSFSFFQSISSFLYAIILAFLVFLFGIQYSIRFSCGIYIGFLFSIWLTAFARNLYWVPFTWFLPMLLVLLNNRSTRPEWIRSIFLFTGITVSVFLKSLCGYEYLSCIVLSAAACTVLSSPLSKQESTRISYLRYLLVCLSSFFGFFIALLLNAKLKGGGSIRQGLQYIYDNDFSRRVISSSTIHLDDVARDQMRTTVFQNIITYTENQTFIPGITFSMLIMLFFLFLYTYHYHPSSRKEKFSLFVVLNFISSISWILLARGHSAGHPHMNYVVWSITFGPVLFGWIAWKFLPEWFKGKNDQHHFSEAIIQTGATNLDRRHCE